MTTKNMKKQSLILIIAFFCVKSFAQLGMPMVQYSGNQLLFNPACIGFDDVLAVNLSVRKQWIQLPGSPSLINFNAHMPTKNHKHALGVILQREEWGPLAGNFGYANYAYKVYFSKHVLSLGLQAGFYNSVLDWTKIEHIKDPNDPTLRKDQQSNTNLDVNFGMYWLARNYYLGFSAKHLMPPKLDFARDTFFNKGWYPHMSTQFFLMGGYAIPLQNRWSLRPEGFIRYVHHTPLAVNVGLHAVYDNRYFLGTNVQTGQNTVSFSLKGFVTDWLRIGYSYSVYFGAIQSAQQGSHEISINYQRNNLWRKQRTVGLLWL
jgi:type IX secretion system PorP/SprF family membrane protein